MKYKAILFDFDGVIVDSMGLKLDSYCYAFEEYKIAKEAIRKVQIENAGFSRTIVIQEIYKKYINININNQDISYLLYRFGKSDEESKHKMTTIESTCNFIKNIYNQYFTAIITGTPQTVIEQTVKEINLINYFNKILGSPKTKIEHIFNIIQETNYKKTEYVYIGDARNDQIAAESNEIDFIGFGDDSSIFKKNSKSFFYDDLGQFEKNLVRT